MLPPAIALLLMIAAACGAGGAALKALGIDDTDPLEHAVDSFVLGTGILGWAVFFFAAAGFIRPFHLIGLTVVLGAGLVTFRGARPATAFRFGQVRTLWFLLAVVSVSLIIDLIAGLAPPADADSLAYHFATPKLFLQAGHLFFMPRAVDGAAPMLLHMTYLAALGLGGETCMTLWAAVTGCAAGAMVFVAGRHLMSDEAALAAAVLFLTTPAVVYGAVTGQVEVRNAAFVVLAVLAATRARRHLGYALLAGTAAGFFAASKYTGLIFMASLGLVALAAWRRLPPLIAFGIAALIAGSQWYVWLWIQSGDPVYPMMSGILPYRDGIAWNQEFGSYFKEALRHSEIGVPQTLGWLLVYPWVVTFAPDPTFDAGRVGFGPAAWLVLPFAIVGAVKGRRNGLGGPAVFLAAAVGYYLLWFFLGPSQRVRHFLPVYPLAILALVAAADRVRLLFHATRLPLAAALGGALFVQLAGQAVYAANPARTVLGLEDRDTYLARNVGPYPAARRVNEVLGPKDRVLILARDVLYYVDVPYFYGHPVLEMQVDVRPDNRDVARFIHQMDAQGITHLLMPRDQDQRAGAAFLLERLIAEGCAREIDRIPTYKRFSRTLGYGAANLAFSLIERTPASCRVGGSPGPEAAAKGS